MAEPEDVDAMLEQALDNVEEADRNGKSDNGMTDLIEKANGQSSRNSDEKGGKDSDRRKSRSRSRERKKHRSRSSSSSRSRSRSRDRKKKRSRSRDRKRRDSSRDKKRRSRSRSSRRSSRSRKHSRSRSRKRSRSHRRESSRDRYRRPSPRRRRSRSPGGWQRPRVTDHRGSPPWRRRSPVQQRGRLPGPERRDVMPFTANRSPPPNAKDMTPEERDERTVFILQLARNTRPTDLEDFFSSVGHVRDVRIITDSKTRRSKGIAYVEFWEKEAIPLALGLAGQRLCGAPIIIQQTCAERNRAAAATVGGAIGFGPSTTGPLKLCVQQLHSNITDEMLSAIFEPFGRIESCEVAMQPPGVSKGFGYVVFRNAEEGKRAMEQLNGFELAGKNIRIITVDEEEHRAAHAAASHRLDEGERAHLGTNGRLQLMAKLAQGSGMELPKNATDALVHQQTQQQQYAEGVSPIATQCFMLSNMFDPAQETEPGWELDVRDDVIDECNNHGGIVHIYIDMASPEGNVYVKCPTVAAADRSVGALHGRWFSGKVITANYVPVISYHELFPDSMHATHLLKSRDRT